MNILLTILLGLCNILYNIYEMLIYTGVSIIYIHKFDDERDEIFKKIIFISNKYCKNISYEFGWKCAEIATVTNIFYKKTFIPSFHYLTNDYFRYPLLLIKDGEEIMYIKNTNSPQLEEMEYDLLFYTNYNENDPKKNYTIIRECGIKDNQFPIEDKCDVNFIIFQLTMDNDKFDINLKEPKNFLLKNNELTYDFFKWYMKKVYNKNLSEDYSVNYMCQDMSTASLISPFYIKFGDDGVTSVSLLTSADEEEEDNNEPSAEEDEEEEDNNEPSAEEDEEEEDNNEPSAEEDCNEPSADEEEDFTCKKCGAEEGRNWCFKCDRDDICESCEGVGGDYGEHEEWVCNNCLPICLKCGNQLFVRGDDCCGEGRSDIKEDSESESELSKTDEENNDKGPTFCSYECVLKARRNLEKKKENKNKKENKKEEENDDSFEYIEKISENTSNVNFSKKILSSIVKTEQQKLHQK